LWVGVFIRTQARRRLTFKPQQSSSGRFAQARLVGRGDQSRIKPGRVRRPFGTLTVSEIAGDVAAQQELDFKR
jgi:hypothetical protein